MTVERVAEFLAAHALILLALGILAACVALSSVAGAVYLLRRYRLEIGKAFGTILEQVRRIDLLDGALAHSRVLIPGSYLALHLLLGLAATSAAVFFLVIAQQVIGESAVVRFDVTFARELRAAVTPGWERLFVAVSWLGQLLVLAAAATAVALRLFLAREPMIAFGWIAAQAGGGILNFVLKAAYARTRPEFADPLLSASSWSFPSGHTMGTFVLVGVGCYLLLRDTRSWAAAVTLISLSLAWCIVMAFSRLYLGEHFASDVVAGLVAGAAWVAVCASAFEMVRRRRGRRVLS